MAKQTNYEAVFIVSNRLSAEATAETVKRFIDLIAANGTVIAVDEWGKRRFAYEIDYEQEGYYVLVTFACGPDFPAELDRNFRITEGIVRSLIVARDEDGETAKKPVTGGTDGAAKTAPAEKPAPAEESVPAAEAAPAEEPAPAAEAAPAEEPAPAAEAAPAEEPRADRE